VLHAASRPIQLDLTVDEAAAQPDGAYQFISEGQPPVGVRRDAGSWTVTDASAAEATLAAQAEAADFREVQGRIALAEPVPGQAVPPSALITSADGATACVVTASGGTYGAVPVEPVEASVEGQAVFVPALEAGTPVLVNPGDIETGVTCR
jgi:hypothetical protein